MDRRIASRQVGGFGPERRRALPGLRQHPLCIIQVAAHEQADADVAGPAHGVDVVRPAVALQQVPGLAGQDHGPRVVAFLQFVGFALEAGEVGRGLGQGRGTGAMVLDPLVRGAGGHGLRGQQHQRPRAQAGQAQQGGCRRVSVHRRGWAGCGAGRQVACR
jgi:hypothetical protein